MIFGKSLPNLERKIQSSAISRWRQLSLQSEQAVEEEALQESATEQGDSWSTGQGEYVRLIKSDKNRAPEAPAQQTVQPREQVLEHARSTQSTNVLPLRTEARAESYDQNVRTALGPGTLIDGKFSFDSPVRIDGDLSGEVSSTSALIVGEEASVKADIQVGSLIVFGQVSGKVDVRDLVEIRAGGRIEADIRAERVVIEHGGYFNGYCHMA